MQRLVAARGAGWPHPEAAILDAIEATQGQDDGSPFHEQAQSLLGTIDVCLRMAGRGCYSGKLGHPDDLRWLRRSLGELLGRLKAPA
jgi:hypothetical protein